MTVPSTALPVGWASAVLGDLCDLNPKHSKDLPGTTEVSFAPMAAVDDVHGELATSEVRPLDGVRTGYTHFADGDVLFAKITPCMENGKAAIARRLKNGLGCGSTEFFVLRSRGGVVAEFLHRFLRQEAYRNEARAAMTGVVGQARVPREFLEQTELPVPPLSEQKRIVAKIEELTARSRRAKEVLDAVPPLLDQLRQSILAAAFRGDLTADWRAKNPDSEPADKLIARIRAERRDRWKAAELAKLTAKGKRPTDDRWKERYVEPAGLSAVADLPRLPTGWAWVRAEEVCGFITKGTTPAAAKMHDGRGAVPFIKVYNLTLTGELDFSVNPTFIDSSTHIGELARSRVLPGDVLMNIVGPPLGKVSMVPTDHPEWNINQAIAVFRPVLGVNREYLCLALLESGTIDRAVRLAKATAGQSNLTLEICRDIPLPLPSEEEQREVVKRVRGALDRVDEIRARTNSNTSSLVNLDASVLAKAFRGELVPQDSSDEPATVLLERIRAARDVAEVETGPRRRSSRAEEATEAAHDGDDGCGSPAPPLRSTPERQATSDLSELNEDAIHDEVFAALWPQGPLEKEEAVRRVAEHLRKAGYVEFQKLRSDGPLYAQLLAFIESAVKAGRLDRPKRGQVRACKADATVYTAEDWRRALLASLGTEPVERDEAIRAGAEWARDNLGLAFVRLRSDGHIVESLRSAINSAIRRGDVIRCDATRIARSATLGAAATRVLDGESASRTVQNI